jgi:hypothetical protein
MSEEFFSVNAAADALRRDRRTVAKALRNVAPDATERGHGRWRLDRVAAAVATHDAQSRDGPKIDPLLQAIEMAAVQVDAALRRLRGEPDPDRRREIFERGFPLGDLDRAFATHLASLPADERMIVEPFVEQSMRQVFSEVLALVGIDPAELVAEAA